MSWLLVPICLPLETVASQQGQLRSLSLSPLYVSQRHLRSQCLVWNKPLRVVSSVTQSTKPLPMGIQKQGRRDAARSPLCTRQKQVFMSSRKKKEKKRVCVCFLVRSAFFTDLSFPLGLQAFPGSCCSFFCWYQHYEYACLIFTHSSVRSHGFRLV